MRTVLDLSCASDVTHLNQTGKSDRLECARHRGGRGASASGSASAAALSLMRPAPPCRGGHRRSGAVRGARRGANLVRFTVGLGLEPGLGLGLGLGLALGLGLG